MELLRLTQGQAVSQPTVGGKYELYGGMIHGEYTKVEDNSSVTMKWRMKDWKDGVFSTVVISFTDLGDDSCEVAVEQTEIPEYDQYDKFVHLDNLEGGWRQMVFERMEQVFGYSIKK